MDNTNLVEGAVLNVEDISKEVEPFLSEAGKRSLQTNKVYELEGVSGEGSVRFLGTRRGAQRLAELINEYSEAFHVVGVLSPPMAIPMHDGSKIYICYLAFTPAAARIIDKLIKSGQKDGLIQEGEAPSDG